MIEKWKFEICKKFKYQEIIKFLSFHLENEEISYEIKNKILELHTISKMLPCNINIKCKKIEHYKSVEIYWWPKKCNT